MTDSASNASGPAATRQQESLLRRGLPVFLGVTLLSTLLAITVVLWFCHSDSGTQAGLSILSRLTGIQFSGVSGHLAHQLRIRHIDYRRDETLISIDNLELQWQPGMLLQRQLQLDYLRLDNLELVLPAGDNQPGKLPLSLQLPDQLRLVRIGQVEVSQVHLFTLDQQHQRNQPQFFSSVKATALIDPTGYKVGFSGNTPWGNASLEGSLGSSRPFQVEARFDWQGRELKQNDMILPASTLHGALSGNLSRIAMKAQWLGTGEEKDHSGIVDAARPAIKQKVTDKASTTAADSSSGEVTAILTPFAALPVEVLQLDLAGVNPKRFQANAPTANLHIRADFRMSGNSDSPVLSGHLFARNLSPGTFDSGGLPVVRFNSDLAMTEKKITWTSTKIELDQVGLVSGAGQLIIESNGNDNKLPQTLPKVSAQLTVADINLLRIDSRLKTTRLSGDISIENHRDELTFRLNLQDPLGKSTTAQSTRLAAEMTLDQTMTLSASQLELRVNDAVLRAHGSMAFSGNNAFSVQGEAHNFNPSTWVDVPVGHVSTGFTVTGQLHPHWRVNAKVTALEGQFAGLDLHGESDLEIRQNQLLSIKKLALSWGKNSLSAQGNWQLGPDAATNRSERLQFSVAVVDLAALSQPFSRLFHVALRGSVSADGVLSGNAAYPSGHVNLKADHLALPDTVYLDTLQAAIALEDGDRGHIQGDLTLSGLSLTPENNASADTAPFRLMHLQANLAGQRQDHTLNLSAVFSQHERFDLQAAGHAQTRDSNHPDALNWSGDIQKADWSGPVVFQLMAPFHLQLTADSGQVGEANWQGNAGNIHVEKIDWSRGQFNSSGQLHEIQVIKALSLWRTDLPVSGNLTMDASWQWQMGQHTHGAGPAGEQEADPVWGQLAIRRTGGDLMMHDPSNSHSPPVALGLQTLSVRGSLGRPEMGTGSETLARDGTREQAQQSQLQTVHPQRLQLQLEAQGNQLGLIHADATGYLTKTEHGWAFAPHAPLTGQAIVQMNEIRWISPLLGTGIALQGAVDATANLGGSTHDPRYSATVEGRDLQVAFTELGIVLPNGRLSASISQNQLSLISLKFSQSIKNPPRHESLNDLPWLKETGSFESAGSIDLATGQGSIFTHWKKFPFMQNPGGWMVGTGEAQLVESEKSWNLSGQLITDAAYFSVPKQAPPKLSSDVVVLKKNDRRVKDTAQGLQTSLDFSIKTGDNFIFVGRGLDTRLSGDIRLRSKNGGSLLATGSIQTSGGTYEGYGQQLAIDRGILNFQGPLDNPGLNVRAIRRGLPVEAGVEVVGTVARPVVHLISEPNVPDPDKLSWMVLGRGADQAGGSEATLLLSAAGAIFGEEDGGSMPATIAHSLGLGDVSFGTTTTAPQSQMPNQTVAGTISSSASSDQVFSVGKRIAPNLVFSIERSLSDASNGLKLTWQLTRRFSIIGRAGTDTAIDGQYLFSFD